MTDGESAYTLGELAELLGLRLQGDAGVSISGLASLASATAEHMSFYTGKAAWRQRLRDTKAGAVLLHPKDADQCPSACLLSEDPYLAYARVSSLFKRKFKPMAGVHPSAVVEEDAQVAPGASIGAHCYIGAGAVIEDAACLESGVFVGAGAHVGSASVVRANVVIESGVRIGARAVVHAAVVLGADGFGFAPDADGWRKIEQFGGLRIGDHVEIGAGTTIDRGALDDTVIGDGVKVDNQVHIGHNCRIGDNSILAGGVFVGGSARIGRGCRIGGCAVVKNDVSIPDGTELQATSVVLHDLSESGSYSSALDVTSTRKWWRSFAHFLHLEDFSRRLKRLERRL